METRRLQSLLESFLTAATTPAQEEELRHLLADIDESTLAPPLYADVRLARTLLGSVRLIPMPDAFMPALEQQLDAMAETPSRRRRWLWRIIPTTAAAAAVALFVSMPFLHNSDNPADNAALSSSLAISHPSKEIQSPTDVNAEAPATRHAPTLACAAKATPAQKQKKSAVNLSRHKHKTEGESEGITVITEYYKPGNDADNPSLAYSSIDAPVVIIDNGETYTCSSLDQSPDAMAMLEEAFELLSFSGKEAERGFDDSKRIVKTAIKQLNAEHDNY